MCDKGANDLAQYTYGNANWGDLLTAYRGTTITYDSIGNPLSYYNGSGYTFTWTGRRLTSAVHGSNTITYTYNDEGIRTSKTVSGVEHIYHLDGSLIVAEEWDNKLCIYLYDADGSPIGMQYRSKTMAEGVFYTFWFEKNLQGDIVAVYNESGVKVYSYSYDAWGNVLITRNSATGTNGYAVYNPFYYRGYYRDSETGFYYLQSRYYDPQVGRFINADGQLNGGLLGYNLFAYCGNNPVMNVDPDGHAWWHWALAATVVAACAVATVITCGGFAAAVTAVGLVASGSAAATASATIAASAFITSALALEAAACDAAINSSSVDEFMEQGSWWTVASVAGAAGFGGFAGYQMYKAQNPDPNPSTTSPCDGTNRGQHLSGVQSPKKMSVPDGSYTQYDSQGKIYSYTQYDSQGRQSMRIDFQGKEHAGVMPHIHLFEYPERGGRIEHVFDLNWNKISNK